VFEPTFGNPPAQPLRYPTEISSNANAPIGIKRRIVRLSVRMLILAKVSEASASVNTNAISQSVRVAVFGPNGGRVVCAEPRAVVVMDMVVLVPALTDEGLNDAAVPVGRPLAANVILPGNAPPTVAVAIVKFADCPAVTVCVVVVAVTLKSVIVNVSAFDVPPPGAGFTTVIAAVPLAAMSAAVIAAVNCVALTNVVVRALPLNCATELLMKLVPFRVKVNAAPPAPVEVGTSEVSVGTGFAAVIVNVSAFDVVPEMIPSGWTPANTTVGVNILTEALPTVAISAAVIEAVNCVEFTNVVVRLLPFHCTTDVLMKLLPLAVNVNAAPPAIAELGASVVNAGIGVETVKNNVLDVPPPGVGLNTVTPITFAV